MKLKVPKHVADQLCGLSKKDFKVQTFKAPGNGGQRKNKVETAVRIIHIATGIAAEATNTRSQATNKEEAFRKLILRLVDHYTEEDPARRINLGWAEKIRTYHQPRNTVKDHRTGTEHPYDLVLDGDISAFIESCVLQLGTGPEDDRRVSP